MIQQIKQLPISEEDHSFIEKLEVQAMQKQMTLGVFGSFSVGKSALINALLGQQNLLPTHTNETTAIPTFIQGGEENRIVAYSFNGTATELSDVKFHALTAGGAVDDLHHILIERNVPSWLSEITLIDTPGRNTKFKAHIEASEQALITSDAALYVMPWQGLTLEDIVYLKQILRYQPNLYFVINKVDRIDESQGISIEEMQVSVAGQLKEQLGKDFPVFAVSALTGYNIDKLYVDFILPLKNQIATLKERRLNYAIEQFLMREKERTVQQLALYEQAITSEGSDFTIQKQEIQLQYEAAQIEVSKQVGALKETIEKTENEMQRLVQKRYEQLEVALKNIAKENLEVDQLSLKVENEIVSARNELFEALHGRIQKLVGDGSAIQLTSFNNATVNFSVSDFDLASLQQKYEQEREKTFNKIEAARKQLETLPVEGKDLQRDRLQKEIEELTEQALERFVPEYIFDESYDGKKGEKIASVIGFVGDMALTVALAAATAGASAAAQVGGKVAAKEATKKIAADATSKLAKEAAKKAAKEAAKEAAKVAAKKVIAEGTEKAVIQTIAATSKEDSALLKTAKALDQVTSPVQTLAKKIGQQIDSTRSQPKREDLQHRQQFFSRKLEVETERDNKLRQLEALEMQAATNERIRQELTAKREQVEKTMSAKLAQMDEQYAKETERLQQEHIQNEVSAQLQQVLEEEEANLNLWFKNEMANLLNAAQQMLPQQLTAQVHQWEQQIAQVEQLKDNDLSKIQQLIDESRTYLSTIESMIKGN